MPEPWNDEAFLARFAEKVERGDGECWIWTGAAIRGRGSIKYLGKAHLAPRLAKIIHDRQWPKRGMQACHSCDNPACVRAEHIWWGTNRENSLDASAKGRFPAQAKTHCRAGHPLSGENLRHSKEGHRICRICAAAKMKRWRVGKSPTPLGDAPNTGDQHDQ